MQQWVKIGCNQVNEFLATDKEYQTLLFQRDEAEKAYLQFIHNLSEQDRMVVEHYLALCEEVEHRRTVTAYQCGRLFR